MRYLAILFAFCFFLSAYVQLNDPDPLVWIILYGFPALVSLFFLKKRLPSAAYLALALIYLAIAIFQWPPEFEGFLFGEVEKMRSLNIELARESFGMGIVSAAMFIFWRYAKRAEKNQA